MLKQFIPLVLISIAFAACNNQQNSFSTDISVPVTIEEVKLDHIEEVFTTTGTIFSQYESVLTNEASRRVLFTG